MGNVQFVDTKPFGELRGLATIRAADVKPERVRWLWPGRVPLGKLTVLDGDPGLGKSTITVDLTGRVSTASPMPDGHLPDEPMKVLLLSAEDGVADTIRPRLEVAGADLDLVDIVDHVADDGGPRPVEIPADLDRIEVHLASEAGYGLMVVDPLMAFLGAEVNSNRDQDVRRALYRLKLLAESTGVAVLVVRHLNKMVGANPLYRGGGSIGIVGAARAGLLVAPDPDDETDTRRVLAVSKSNLAAKPPSLAYRIVGDDLYDTARVVWEGATSHTAEGLLGHPVDRPSPEQDRAETFLAEQLASGPRPAEDLRDLAEARALAWRTVQRASDSLEVEVKRQPEPGKRGRGPSWWSLPSTGQGIRAATNTALDGAYSSGEQSQVSGSKASPNGICAKAPSVLNLGVQSAPGPNGSRVWRCGRCDFETTYRVVASYPHTNCGGLFQAVQEVAR